MPRPRSAGRSVAVGLAVLGLVVVAFAAGSVGGRPHAVRVDVHTAQASPTTAAPTGTNSPSPTPTPHANSAGAGDIVLVLVLLVAAAAVVVAVVVGLHLIGRLRAPRLRRPAARPGAVVVSSGGAEELADALDRGLDDLTRGPVSDAIIGCWLRVEALAVRAGAHVRAADTSAEFADRVVAAYDVRAEPVRELARLYREARFSQHPMTETARDRAAQCVRAVREDLHAGS